MEDAGDGIDESQVETIFLDGNCLGELSVLDKEYLERFTSLKHLSLADTNLKSVRNMPLLPSLEDLDLSNNAISGDEM